jgi:hypothetical protein
MSKKNKKQKSDTRRERELQRLQETVQRQAEEMAAAPPQPQKAEPPKAPEPSLALPQFDEFMDTDDELWNGFQHASAAEKQRIYLETLEAGETDDEYAFEMLEDIRNTLDIDTPAGRARYAELVGQLQQTHPDIYRQSFAYYNSSLIRDAIADARWEALPELLAPFAEEPDRGIDMFYQVIDQLLYHGQIKLLLEVMSRAVPIVTESDELVPWVEEEFNGQLMELHLFKYLETASDPRGDDPALLAATARYGEWKPGWLARFVPRFTANAPSAWQPENFDDTVDADQWHDNLSDLIAEFIANQHNNGSPYSRAYMIWNQLNELLGKRYLTPTLPESRRGNRRTTKQHRRTASKSQHSYLIPTYQDTEKALVEHFQLLDSQPYRAIALMEFLPPYLHFITRLGLIHPKEMDEALDSLNGLMQYLPTILESHAVDPIARHNVSEAWSKPSIAALKDDPALSEARTKPPTPPTSNVKTTPRRPGVLQTYTFKVTYLRDPEVWRIIEMTERQTLHDLHNAIQDAVDFDNDHMYSFYMNGQAWDNTVEYAHPSADAPSAAGVRIGDFGLRIKHRFLYLFDYGDDQRFEVQLININPDAPKADYPRITEQHGDNPEQYPGWDEDEEWDEDEA